MVENLSEENFATANIYTMCIKTHNHFQKRKQHQQKHLKHPQTHFK